MSNPCQQLRELLARPSLIRSLAAHDVFTARICESVGMELVFLGGFGAAASGFGLPDLGLLGLAEMSDACRRMTSALSIPLIVDGDTGYGSLPNVRRTIREFERAGAAGMLLEDQVYPKRCGHFEGKAVVSMEEISAKLKAALDVRSNADFVIIARTDARATAGLAAAIDRACRFLELGADVCFVEAPRSREELERLGQDIPGPQLANMLTGGSTPILSAEELQSLGFKIAVAPIETLAVTGFAVRQLAQTMLRQGRVDQLTPHMLSFQEMKELLGVSRWLKDEPPATIREFPV